MAGPACYVSSLEAGKRRGALSAPSAHAASVGLEHVYECQHSGDDAEDDRECGRDSRGGGQDHPDCDDDDGDRREGLGHASDYTPSLTVLQVLWVFSLLGFKT